MWEGKSLIAPSFLHKNLSWNVWTTQFSVLGWGEKCLHLLKKKKKTDERELELSYTVAFISNCHNKGHCFHIQHNYHVTQGNTFPIVFTFYCLCIYSGSVVQCQNLITYANNHSDRSLKVRSSINHHLVHHRQPQHIR